MKAKPLKCRNQLIQAQLLKKIKKISVHLIFSFQKLNTKLNSKLLLAKILRRSLEKVLLL